MGVRVTANFTKGSFVKQAEASVADFRKKVMAILFEVGEKCVNDARLKGSYTDRTGNLRSSTGYRVISNGLVVGQGGFQPVKDGATGSETGKEYIDTVSAEYASFDGLVLIVVAGMNYASYVEDKGFNVLSSADILAEKLIKQLISKL